MHRRISYSLPLTILAVLFLFISCNGNNGSSNDEPADEPSLESISITPSTSTLFVGGTIQLTATGAYSDATTADLTSQVTWNSSDTAIATVSETGLLSILAQGNTELTASLDTVTSDALTPSVLVPIVSGDSMSSFHTDYLPLAYTTNDAGSSWELTAAFPLAQEQGVLNELVCVESHCVAAGLSFTNVPDHYIPLVYTSDDAGLSWDLAPAFSFPAGQTQGTLNSVTCTDSLCVAVGQSWDAGLGNGLPLAYSSSDNGSTWNLSADLTLPGVQTGGLLSDVSCQGTACTVVGTSNNAGNNELPFVYTSTDSGSTWTLATALNLPGTQTQASLTGITCKNSNCLAVGQSFDNSDGNNLPLAYTSTDGGSTWTLSPDFEMPQATGHLEDIFCQDDDCVAVGSSDSLTALTIPLAYTSTDRGSTWTLAPAFTLPGAQEQAQLNGIMCADAVCLAQGISSTLADANPLPLAYKSTDGGNTWELLPDFELPDGQTLGEFY